MTASVKELLNEFAKASSTFSEVTQAGAIIIGSLPSNHSIDWNNPIRYTPPCDGVIRCECPFSCSVVMMNSPTPLYWERKEGVDSYFNSCYVNVQKGITMQLNGSTTTRTLDFYFYPVRGQAS